jgi:cytochrome c biogenesis protein CcmG/thiol:disulfide interchange protein DsbE
MRKAVLIVVAIALVIGIYEVGRRNSAHSKPGRPSAAAHSVAPDFSLRDLNNQTLDLANYRGKVVLLDFWATWCTPCRDEIPRFVEFQNKYRERGLQVIGISMDDDAKPVREFYRQFKMNYPVALGNEKIAEAYGGVLGLPITFLIGREGRVAAKHIGELDMSVLEQEIETLLQAK